MKKIFLLILILALILLAWNPASAANKFYWATALTGGGDALDGIDAQNLNIGDGAIVDLDSGSTIAKIYFYRIYNSGTADDGVNVIAPDTDTGGLHPNYRWHLANIYTGGLSVGGLAPVLYDDTASCIYGNNASKTVDCYQSISFNNAAAQIYDNADDTKKMLLDPSGNGTGLTLTFKSNITSTDKTLNVGDITTGDYVAVGPAQVRFAGPSVARVKTVSDAAATIVEYGQAGTGNITTTGTIDGGTLITLSTDATVTVSGSGGIYLNNSDTAKQFNLPADPSNKVYCFGNKTYARALTLAPNASDYLIVGGTALAQGATWATAGTSVDWVCVVGVDTSYWRVSGGGAGVTEGVATGGLILGDSSPDAAGEIGYDGDLKFYNTELRTVAVVSGALGTPSFTALNIPSGTGDAGTTAGNIVHDNNDTAGNANGNLEWYDGAQVRSLVDTGTNYTVITKTEYIPVGYMEDGAAPPAAASVLASTRKVKIRAFDGASDENLEVHWIVPTDYVGGIKFRFVGFVNAATAPANTEVVAFSLAGCSLGNSDVLGCTVGTAQTSSLTADATYVQYDRLAGAYSSEITVTDIAAAESVMFLLTRLAASTDTYAQDFGLAGIEIKYKAKIIGFAGY